MLMIKSNISLAPTPPLNLYTYLWSYSSTWIFISQLKLGMFKREPPCPATNTPSLYPQNISKQHLHYLISCDLFGLISYHQLLHSLFHSGNTDYPAILCTLSGSLYCYHLCLKFSFPDFHTHGSLSSSSCLLNCHLTEILLPYTVNPQTIWV